MKKEVRESEEEHIEEKHELPDTALSPSEEESEDSDSDSGSGQYLYLTLILPTRKVISFCH